MEDEYKERDNHSESRNFFSVVSGDRLRTYFPQKNTCTCIEFEEHKKT
jgi:hypothetical protein